MSAVKYLVPAMAAVGRAAAASCSAATTTIQNAGDASALSGCSTFSGSIAIATGTTDSIALDGIQKIQGSLIANNVTGMSSLSASTLQTITDTFSLQDMTILTNLNFPVLTNVETIDWNALAALSGLSFTNGVQTASTVMIQDTQLQSLSGINLQVVDTMFITNNNYLNNINMQLGNVSTSLTIEANGRNVTANFPNMMWAYNITMRNITSVSMPSLGSVNGSLGFYSNEFASLSTPNLTRVGGSLSFVSNTDLSSIDMPSLTTIGGGFQIANNTDLSSVEFDKLKSIGGALDYSGNFTNVSLPALGDVRGAFNLQSSADVSSSCNVFSKLAGTNNVIKGKFQCAGEQAHPGGQGTTVTGSSSSSTSTSKGDASGFNARSAAGFTGLMGVVAAMFGML